MGTKFDLTGTRYTKLVVEKEIGKDKRGNYIWRCRCDCGGFKEATSGGLNSGHVQSCGCLKKEAAKAMGEGNVKHGGSRRGDKHDPEYYVWYTMRQRCRNPNVKGYENYGGRGIKVCDRWEKYENFKEDMGRRPSDKHQIDRFDNDGDYCRENCVWSLRKVNQRNTRKTEYMTVNGVTRSQAEWSEVLGINRMTIWSRKKRGWSDAKALLTPLDKRGQRKKPEKE